MSKGVVILTGAGSGIGAATARRLSADGYALLLVGRDPLKLKKVAAGLVTPAVTLAQDITHPDAPERVLREISHSALGQLPIHALINNAAIFHRLSFLTTTESMWREEIETNLMAPVRLIQTLLPQMPEGSVILNVSSTLGIRPVANTIAYSAVKAALNSLTQGLALELAPRIRVCAVCPGLIDTPIHPFHSQSDETDSKKSAHLAQPMQRMGRPEEIAAAISFLIGPESTWTTGSLHVVDGGISLL